MLMQNVLYSEIDLYIKKINQYLSDGYMIRADYKTYDKSENNFVRFKCFDIKSLIETTSNFSTSNFLTSNFLISEIKYDGYLEFTYNKATNEIYISKLPYITNGNVKIPIFTSDIAQIIVDKMKVYIPSDDIKLVFSNPSGVFAIDEKVKEIIPSIIGTKNFNMINRIIEEIALEEARIRQHILKLKAQKDREDRAIERAVAKKRSIYGIDPKDYEEQQEFYSAVNKKICEVYSRKIEKIERHLSLNVMKYKEMLNNGFLSVMQNRYHMLISSDECFSNWAGENKIDIDKFEYIFYPDNMRYLARYFGEEIDIEQTKKEWEQLKVRYIDYIYQYDLNDPRGILSLVDFIKREIMPLPELREPDSPRIDNNTLYTEVVGQLASITDSRIVNNEVNKEYDYDYFYHHPIFGAHNYRYTKTWNGKGGYIYKYYFSQDIGRAIELLLQIRSLTKQLQYYCSVLDEPSKALLSFKKSNNSWASIMQFPYFVRMGRDPFCYSGHDLFNLLMVKPGTLTFDVKNIRYFVQKGDDEKNVSTNADRMIVAIPDSLEYYDLLMVIKYAHDSADDLNFICQSPDLQSRVKSILINMELCARKKNGSYIKGNYFINVDPNYYDSFFVNTPDNKKFWHRYDYSSDYPYRRKIVYDLKTIIDMCIQEYLLKYHDSKEINYDILSAMLMGSYSSNHLPFDLDSSLLAKQGIDGRTLPDDDDRVLALMHLYPYTWKKELSLIDMHKDLIDSYMKNSGEDFPRIKEEMLVFKELFPHNWQEMWRNSPDMVDIRLYKDLFPEDWEEIWSASQDDSIFYPALKSVCQLHPEKIKEQVRALKKSPKRMIPKLKSWVYDLLDEEYGGLPF